MRLPSLITKKDKRAQIRDEKGLRSPLQQCAQEGFASLFVASLPINYFFRLLPGVVPYYNSFLSRATGIFNCSLYLATVRLAIL